MRRTPSTPRKFVILANDAVTVDSPHLSRWNTTVQHYDNIVDDSLGMGPVCGMSEDASGSTGSTIPAGTQSPASLSNDHGGTTTARIFRRLTPLPLLRAFVRRLGAL